MARWPCAPSREPAIWIAPENSSSFSVSVVLPASGWEMMAKVRRRRTSVARSGIGSRRRRDEAAGWNKDYPVRRRARSRAPSCPRAGRILLGRCTWADAEMPDVTVYAERLARRVVGKRLQRIKVLNPFLVRTRGAAARHRRGPARRGRRAPRQARSSSAFEGELFLVDPPDDRRPPEVARAGQQAAGADRAGAVRVRDRRHACCSPKPARSGAPRSTCCRGRDALAAMDPGGIDVMTADLAAFAARLPPRTTPSSAR